MNTFVKESFSLTLDLFGILYHGRFPGNSVIVWQITSGKYCEHGETPGMENSAAGCCEPID